MHFLRWELFLHEHLLPTPHKKRDVQDLFFSLTEERQPPVMLALEYKNPELVLFFCVYVCFCF